MRRRLATAGLLVVPAAFLAVFFAVPAAAIVTTGLRPDGAWDLGAVPEVLGRASTRRVAWFTLWQAAPHQRSTISVHSSIHSSRRSDTCSGSRRYGSSGWAPCSTNSSGSSTSMTG